MGELERIGTEWVRADWRFLLPAGPRAHTLIVDPAGSAGPSWQWLVDDGWTGRVSRRPDPDDPADVVVVRAGGSLDAALETATANASLLIELPRSPRRLPNRTGPQLEAAGFTDRRFYLVTPGLATPKRLTPLDRPAGLHWLLAPAPAPGDHPDRSARSARWAREARTLALTAGAGLLRSPLGSTVADRLLIARRRPPADDEAATPALMTSGHDEGSRVIIVPLGRRPGPPAEVIKLAPRPVYNHNVDAEVATLRSLRSRLCRPAADVLPRVVDTVDVGPLRGSRESYAGRWTAADLCYRRADARVPVLRRVLEASSDFTAATIGHRAPWSPELFDRYVGGLYDRYAERLDAAGVRPLIDAAAERSAALEGWPMPMVVRHHDLGPWNVVFDDQQRLTIVDWESAPPRTIDSDGLAGADQLYFCKYWLHICHDCHTVDDELSAFEFLPGSHAASAASTALAASLRRLGVDPGFVPLLACHIWLEKALYVLERQRTSGASRPATVPDPGPARAYLEALAADRERLFAHWTPGRRVSG